MALEAVVNGKKKKKTEKVGETLRFELELAPTSEESCNEFFYPQLQEEKTEKPVQRVPGDPLAGSEPGNFDPLGEGDLHEREKLEAIAKSFEEKYGAGPKKKKRKLLDLDLVDRGHGYDVSDSFVDDSELYEDFVPPQVDTALGGFYINTGRLDFKCRPDLDPEEADFVVKKKKPSIKKTYSHQKILATQKLKKAKQTALHKTPSKSGKKLLAGTGVTPLVTKLKAEKKLKKTKLGLSANHGKAKPITVKASQASNLSVPVGVAGISVPLLDSATKLSQGDISSPPLDIGAGHDGVNQTEEQADNPPPPPKEPPILPESSLPQDVLSKVKDLEETIRWDQGNGKKLSLKTRSGYDEKLIEIDMLCKAVSGKIRNAVFEFLAYKMGVAKGTLTKRMKAVLKKREDDELEEPLQKLKFAVEESMPGQIAEYEEAKRTESVSSDKAVDAEEESKMEDVFDDSTLVPSANNSLIGTGGGASQPGTTTEGAKVKKTIIRKRYKWTDETRKLLCDVVRIKVESEERVNRITRGSGEDIINQFLDDKVKPLWPKGWMQKSILYKMSEVAHKHFTNPQTKKAVSVKKEKPVIVKKEPLDSKPILPPSPVMRSPSQATPTSGTSSPRTAIPSDPKELVAFLLKDDKKQTTPTSGTSSSHTAFLKDPKELVTFLLKDDKKLATPTSGATSPRVSISSDPRELVSFLFKDDNKLKTKEIINKLLAAKLKGDRAAVTKTGTGTSTSGASSAAGLTVKSVAPPKTSPKKAVTVSKSPKAPLYSSVLKSSSSGSGSGAQTLQVTSSSLSTVPKVEKKKKVRQPKDSPSADTLTAAKPATQKANTVNPPHMLTTTTTGQVQPCILQWVESPSGTPVFNIVSKVQSTKQPSLMTVADTAVATTSVGRLMFTSASQLQQSSSRAQSSSPVPKVASPQLKVKSVERISGTLKGSASVSAGITMGAGTGAKTQQQQTVLSSSRSTPVVQLSRIVGSSSTSILKHATSSHNLGAAKTLNTTPTQLSATSMSSGIHNPSKKTTPPAKQRQPQLISASVPAMPRAPPANKPPTVHSVISTAVSNVRNPVDVVKTVPTPLSVVSLSSGGQFTNTPVIPPLAAVVSPSTGSTQPLVQTLTHRGGASAQPAMPRVPPLIGGLSLKAVPETPPLNSSHHVRQKESSPLKSPVEQIMEEHSYLGSLQPGQSAWTLPFGGSSTPAGTEEVAPLHRKDSKNVYTKDH